MGNRVAGKIALVTGAASGLGRASAMLLAQEGAKVVLVDIDQAGLDAVAREIGPAAMPCKLDVTDASQWDAVLENTVANFGGLNVLVHCAGISLMKTIEETSFEEWRRVNAINLDAVFLGTKAAIPVMRRSGGLASIIMVSSSSGLRGKPKLAAYCASKGGVRLLGKSVALHLARDGGRIRCNVVFPGTIDTPMVRRSFGVADDSPEEMQKIMSGVAGIPVGRLGEPNDIGYMILYLASDESKYVTGAELVVDGGRTAA
jgi:NAD(P)-dependent dehydrogenase (short-subunit alcohol dehydrogenase family)